MNKKLISIGVPCFNEEENVLVAYREIRRVTDQIKKYNFEYIFVDNGSTDRTRKLINELAQKDKKVIGIFLTRNFGAEASSQAALDRAKGDAFIVIYCDLQDPPDLIIDFIKKWEEGYDIIFGVYKKFADNFLMVNARKLFYSIYRKISYINVPINATAFSLIDKRVINALRMLPEKYRFNRGLRVWTGFKTAYISYNRKKRERGKSSYNFFEYIKHAERGVFGFSYLPLDFIIYFGFFLTLLSLIFISIYLLLFFLFGNPLKGSVTIIVSIIFFGGIQLMATSIIGKYIQVIVEEVKARPTYILDKVVNDNLSKE